MTPLTYQSVPRRCEPNEATMSRRGEPLRTEESVLRIVVSALVLAVAAGCQGEFRGSQGPSGGDEEGGSLAAETAGQRNRVSGAGSTDTAGHETTTEDSRGTGGGGSEGDDSAEEAGGDTGSDDGVGSGSIAAGGGGGSGNGESASGKAAGGGGKSGGTGGRAAGSGGRAASGGGAGNSASANGGGAGRGGAGGGSTSTATSSSSSTTCTGHAGPSYEEFFDNSALATIRLTFDQSDFQGTKWLDAAWGKWTHCRPFNYVPVQFQYENAKGVASPACEKVGMRIRGSWPKGTWTVAGFKLDMQTLDTSSTTDKRRFADLNRINVLSIEGDGSHLIQCLTYKVYRDFGLPAPHCNHVKVYVNGTFYGLLENVEQVNKGFLRRHFGNSDGSLYGASPSQSDCTGTDRFEDSLAKLAYNGNSFSSYSTEYQLTQASASDAEQNLVPMLKCADATQTPNDSDFKTCISEWIDVDEWLKEIAAESLTPALESWVGYYRNYYLYFKPDDAAPHKGRFLVWSWDHDTAFQRQKAYPTSGDPFTAVSSFYGPRNARAKFVTRLTTVFRSEYCAAMKSFLSAYDPKVVDEMATVVEAGIQNDKSVTVQTWQSEVSAIRTHITSRRSAMQTQIASSCQ